jgi:hypothetical protein
MLLLYYYYEKARGKAGHAQNILPDRATSGHGLFIFCLPKAMKLKINKLP